MRAERGEEVEEVEMEDIRPEPEKPKKRFVARTAVSGPGWRN